MNRTEEPNYTGDVLKGILLHRAIDSFTDKHPKVREAVLLLRPTHGKYAPVVTDILWDHILSNHWEKYSGESMRVFIDNVYKTIQGKHEVLPKKLQFKIDQMIGDDFLFRYQYLDGLRTSFSFMDRRTKFPSNFVGAVEDYSANKEEFDHLFNDFFPDLISMVDRFCDC